MIKNRSKGFTLTELLIVVAIIAVLAAIAIPIFSVQLEKVERTVELTNARMAYRDAIITITTDADFLKTNDFNTCHWFGPKIKSDGKIYAAVIPIDYYRKYEDLDDVIDALYVSVYNDADKTDVYYYREYHKEDFAE